jgi:hypothetical protein
LKLRGNELVDDSTQVTVTELAKCSGKKEKRKNVVRRDKWAGGIKKAKKNNTRVSSPTDKRRIKQDLQDTFIQVIK